MPSNTQNQYFVSISNIIIHVSYFLLLQIYAQQNKVSIHFSFLLLGGLKQVTNNEAFLQPSYQPFWKWELLRVHWLMQRATSSTHTSLIKILLKWPLNIFEFIVDDIHLCEDSNQVNDLTR